MTIGMMDDVTTNWTTGFSVSPYLQQCIEHRLYLPTLNLGMNWIKINIFKSHLAYPSLENNITILAQLEDGFSHKVVRTSSSQISTIRGSLGGVGQEKAQVSGVAGQGNVGARQVSAVDRHEFSGGHVSGKHRFISRIGAETSPRFSQTMVVLRPISFRVVCWPRSLVGMFPTRVKH